MESRNPNVFTQLRSVVLTVPFSRKCVAMTSLGIPLWCAEYDTNRVELST
jgi:hypothetical protein